MILQGAVESNRGRGWLIKKSIDTVKAFCIRDAIISDRLTTESPKNWVVVILIVLSEIPCFVASWFPWHACSLPPSYLVLSFFGAYYCSCLDNSHWYHQAILSCIIQSFCRRQPCQVCNMFFSTHCHWFTCNEAKTVLPSLQQH